MLMTVGRMMAGVVGGLSGRSRCTRIGTRLAIGLGLVFVVGSVLSLFLVSSEMKQCAIAEAEQKASVMKPSVFRPLKEHGVYDPAFTPEWMS